jgi:methyl-accepting chemotaxis protein
METSRKKSIVSKNAKLHYIISSVIIVVLLIVIPLVTVQLLSSTYDEQIRRETEKNASSISRTVRSFVDGAYSLIYELASNPAVLSMDPEVQKQILEDCAARNKFMELMYITGTDGMQTARSSGVLGDRSERWWFLQMMEAAVCFAFVLFYVHEHAVHHDFYTHVY